MREHEVPTHVQAEDRVLLWLTFPQIVALTAVCALAYGLYHYVPAGPEGVRVAAAALFGLGGLAVVAGRVNGRRLPLVAADLLRYAVGPRRYAGTPAELARSEPPPPPPGAEADPLRLLVKRAGRPRRRSRSGRRRKEGERRNGRMPLRRRFGKRRHSLSGEQPRGDQGPDYQRRGGRGFWKAFLAAAAVALVVLAALPLAAAFAQEPGEEGWTSDELEFQPPPAVPGRRLFVEGLTVTAAEAEVTLRAATDLRLTVRAYGSSEGRSLRYYATAFLAAGERAAYELPLDGPSPSLVFSWEDELGQAGAVSLDGERLPWPLPAVTGELCGVRVAALGWRPGAVEGVIASDCAAAVDEVADLQTAAGHAEVRVSAVLPAEVVAVAGTVTVASGTSETSVSLVAGGETRFRLPVASGEGVHALAIEAALQATLRIPLPPLVELVHRPERTEHHTETAVVHIPAFGDTVTETISVPHDDGTVTEHSVTASCWVPVSTVRQDVAFTVVHPERIEAEVVQRPPLTRKRVETLSLASSIWADDAYRPLAAPDPEPEPEPVRQTPATEDELADWFEELGWEWAW